MSVAGLGIGFDKVRLGNKRINADLTQAITGDPRITRTIDGASTLELTVSDPRARLRRQRFLTEATRIVLDQELRFALVKVAKSGNDLTLTAEDEIVHLMRKKTGPKSAKRSSKTRAQFIRGLVKEAVGDRDVRFVSPELKVKQPIEGGKTKPKTKASSPDDSRREPGIPRNAKGLTVKGAPATLTQKKVADRVIRIALRYNPPRRALVALLTACIVESVMGTRGMTSSVDLDSLGLLQGRQIYNSRKDLLSFEYNVRRFFFKPWTGTPLGGAIKQAKAGRSPGEIAWTIQGPREDLRSRYAEYIPEANNWIRAYFGGEAGDFGDGSETKTKTITIPYKFEVEKDETYWDAAKRLADEVNWRFFVVGNTVYYASEPTLLKGRRRLNIGEDTRGVDNVDWDIDAGKRANSATVTARAKNWQAPPGTVVTLDETHGPARGRWLVSEIDGSLSQQEVTITLKRASRPLPEPKPETRTETSRSSGRPTRRSGQAGPNNTTDALAGIRFRSFAPGSPHWGGSGTIFSQLIKPYVARKYGFRITSEKRSQSGSDHGTSSVNAYAVDYGTDSNYAFGRDIARLLGVPYRGIQDDYKHFRFRAGGRNFRVQIICQTHGTGPHAHIGISRV